MNLVQAPSAPWGGDVADWLMPDDAPMARVQRSALVYDSARVHDYARVHGSAQVYGSTQVHGSAQVYGHGDIADTRDYLTLGPVGSRLGCLTLHRDRELGVRIVAGCWHGSLAAFLSRLTDIDAHRLYRRVVPQLVEELRARMTPIVVPAPGGGE